MAFFPWPRVKWWKISYCQSNFPRSWSMYGMKAEVSQESQKSLWGWTHENGKSGLVLLGHPDSEGWQFRNICFHCLFLKTEVTTMMPIFFMVRKQPKNARQELQNGSCRGASRSACPTAPFCGPDPGNSTFKNRLYKPVGWALTVSGAVLSCPPKTQWDKCQPFPHFHVRK